MIKILIFGENITYRFGGAEISTYRLVKSLEGMDINLISGWKTHLEKKLKKFDYKNINEIKFLYFKLPYLEYLINSFIVKTFLKKYLKKCMPDILFAQNMSASMAINTFEGVCLYFFHDETSLGVSRCYEKSIKAKIKFFIRYILDYPFFLYYRYENKRAVKKSILIANSQYMAGRIKEIFNKEALIVYPYIDVVSLLKEQLPPIHLRNYIMMIGDREIKGINIFKKISEKMPNYEFSIVGNSYHNTKINNIIYHEFVENPIEIYKKAKLVIVPSLVDEGFGMVVVEASALGIPVIVSAKGGLPETVPSKEYVVEDYCNVDKWVDKINWILKNYEYHSKKVKEYVKKFDMRLQRDILLDILHRNISSDRNL